MKERVLVVAPDNCTGCHGCEMACSMRNFGKNHPKYSRIRIWEFRDVNTFIPISCQQCEDPPCVDVCPRDARIRRPTGAVVTDEESCIGCLTCLQACPYGAPQLNPETGKIMTCDLCEGEDEPWCVFACTMNEALKVVDRDKVSAVSGEKYAWEMKEEFKPPVKEEVEEFEFSFD